MKQYRITSADFILPGETLDPDCYLTPEDEQFVKSMSGQASSIQWTTTEVVQPGIIREQRFDKSTQTILK